MCVCVRACVHAYVRMRANYFFRSFSFLSFPIPCPPTLASSCTDIAKLNITDSRISRMLQYVKLIIVMAATGIQVVLY